MKKRVTKLTKVEQDVANYDRTQMQALQKLSGTSMEIFDNLGKKAKKISEDERYTKNDNFALKVADLIIKNVQKQQEIQIKQRAAQKQEVSMFSQMLKDANSGELSIDDLEKIKMYIDEPSNKQE